MTAGHGYLVLVLDRSEWCSLMGKGRSGFFQKVKQFLKYNTKGSFSERALPVAEYTSMFMIPVECVITFN